MRESRRPLFSEDAKAPRAVAAKYIALPHRRPAPSSLCFVFEPVEFQRTRVTPSVLDDPRSVSTFVSGGAPPRARYSFGAPLLAAPVANAPVRSGRRR